MLSILRKQVKSEYKEKTVADYKKETIASIEQVQMILERYKTEPEYKKLSLAHDILFSINKIDDIIKSMEKG